MVEKRTYELKRSQAQLVQAGKLTAIGQLAGGVAHEINNPLSGVLGFSTSLLKEVDNEDLKKVEAFKDFPEYLNLIRESALRCKNITGKLLGFARQSKHEFVSACVSLFYTRERKFSNTNIFLLRKNTGLSAIDIAFKLSYPETNQGSLQDGTSQIQLGVSIPISSHKYSIVEANSESIFSSFKEKGFSIRL